MSTKLDAMEGPLLCAAALLFQKQSGGMIESVIESCFIVFETGDDRYTLKAKAERYIREHSELSKGVKGFPVVAYRFSLNTKPKEGEE